MSNWFRRRPDDVVVDPASAPSGAYQEGRPATVQALDGAPAPASGLARIDAAFQRGRDEERKKLKARRARRGSPLLALIVIFAVVLAGGFIYLAIENGSFSGGGAVVDRNLDSAARSVDAPLKDAAETTGTALQNAGRSLK